MKVIDRETLNEDYDNIPFNLPTAEEVASGQTHMWLIIRNTILLIVKKCCRIAFIRICLKVKAVRSCCHSSTRRSQENQVFSD